VTPDPDVAEDDREDLEAFATAIAKDIEIRLENEAHYDWMVFVQQRGIDNVYIFDQRLTNANDL